MASFTDKYISSLKGGDKERWLSENIGDISRGFFIRVMPSGVKSFYYVYKVEGKKTRILLGRYPAMSLAEAREVYREKRSIRDQGLNPVYVSKSQGANGSFQTLVDFYIQDLKERGRVSADQVETAIKNHITPHINVNGLARDVMPEQIKTALHVKIKEGNEVFANRLRQYLHAAYEFGIKYDNDPRYMDRPITFGIVDNPVGRIPKNTAAEKAGERTLSPKELKYHWDHFTGIYAFVHKLMILLGGQRPTDITSLKWEDVLLPDRVIDPSRSSKNTRVNVLPLSDWAVSVLAGLKMWTGGEEYLFPRGSGGRESKKDSDQPYLSISGNSRAVGRFVKEHDLDHYTSRDLRRTMKTLMGKAGIDKPTRDRLQNHNVSDVSSKHYDRYDYLPEKREALETWERYLKDVVGLEY